MDKYPVLQGGTAVGELATEREPMYQWFDFRCQKLAQGLWCAWAVGSNGELRVGILEPQGENWGIRRRFSHQMTQPLGKLLRGEVRPVRERQEIWKETDRADTLFRTVWVQRSLRGKKVLYQKTKTGVSLLVPFHEKAPFPLMPLFCFGYLWEMNGEIYLRIQFDEKEHPRFLVRETGK